MTGADMPKCDIVMKGGVTSGIVYPRTVVELSRKYRFQQIGGTSAGAIAAVVTAAAEYGRDSGGFDKVEELPQELSTTLKEKFQPRPAFRPIFEVFLATLGGGLWAGFARIITACWRAALIGALPGLVMLLVCGIGGHSAGFVILGGLITILGLILWPLIYAARLVFRELPKEEADFGICSGLTEKGHRGPALTDWLTDTIDKVAGKTGGAPLTVADLKARDIRIATVTTDLGSHRPYALPIRNNLFAFRETEFRRLFPKRVVDHMIAHSAPVTWPQAAARGLTDLHYFQSDEMPIVVLARMSLSFPFLISTVPLWRIDYTFAGNGEDGRLVRCLFTDGGVSSNFPVHFFDQLMPNIPTFGISLAEYDEDRDGDRRVRLPVNAGDGKLLPTYPMGGVISFVMALFNSAKDWQDTLQSVLPGYRERIVTVKLSGDEGGLNLAMDEETICHLTKLGGEAGAELRDAFQPNEHKWRRYLVEIRALDRLLRGFNKAYFSPASASGEAYPDIAERMAHDSFKDLTKSERENLAKRARAIAALGAELEGLAPAIADFDAKMPQSASRLRSIAQMEG